MKTKSIIIATIATALALPAFAADEHGHDHAKDKHGEHAAAAVKIPDTAAALWAEIDAKSKSLAEAVAAKKDETVHEHSMTLEALTGAVSSKYPELAADKAKRIQGQVKNIARVLDALHDEADGGHWDDAAKKLSQFEAALKIMRQQVSQ